MTKNSTAIYLFANYPNSKAKKEECYIFQPVVFTDQIENMIKLLTPSSRKVHFTQNFKHKVICSALNSIHESGWRKPAINCELDDYNHSQTFLPLHLLLNPLCCEHIWSHFVFFSLMPPCLLSRQTFRPPRSRGRDEEFPSHFHIKLALQKYPGA